MTTERFHEHSIKQSKGSVNPYINFRDLTWYEFALPPVDEQQRIVEVLTAIDTVCNSYRAASGEGIFEAALADALSGPPKSWHSSTLGEVAEVQLGRMLSAERASGPDLAPYIKNTNVQWDRVDLTDLPVMTFPKDERWRYELRAGDILVCEGGDPGRSHLLESDLPGIYYQKAVHRVRTTKLLPSYLYFWLVFAYRTGAMRRLCTGTAIGHLPAVRFRELMVSWPPLKKQGEIVSALQACQKFSTAQKELIERLQVFRAVML